MEYIFHTSLKPIRVEALVEAHDWVLPRDHYFPGESHDFWELVFVVEGFVAQTADERVYHLSQGNLVFIKPLAFHRMWIERNSPTRVILLSFRASGEWMRQLEDSCFALNPAQQKHIKKLMDLHEKALVLAETTDQHGYRIAVERTVVEAESFLLQLLEKEEVTPALPQGAEAQYTKIICVMKEHCHEALNLEELAEKCYMSVSNMKRIFRRFSDVGVAKYYLFIRMRRAKELLDEGLPACDVAHQLGFDKVSYFHMVFKREVGMTPNQYKLARVGALRKEENGIEKLQR